MQCTFLYTFCLISACWSNINCQILEPLVGEQKQLARSIALMDELLKLNEDLVYNLEDYVTLLEEKKQFIDRSIIKMKIMLGAASSDKMGFLENPVNSFALIRHMQSDWGFWQIYMEETEGRDQLNYMQEMQPNQPTLNDLNDAVLGMRRIQDVYSLNSLDMAQGLLAGVQYNTTLEPHDCYDIAIQCSIDGEYYKAEQWLLAALQAMDHNNYIDDTLAGLHLNKMDVLERLIHVRLSMNKRLEALEAINHALFLSPQEPYWLRLQQNLYTQLLLEKVRPIEDSTAPHENHCCSGQCEQRKPRLHCVYHTAGSLYMRLAPAKMELLSLDPYIVFYHDVVSPADQSFLRKVSKPHLRPSRTYIVDTEEESVADDRTAKSVWLPWNTNEVTRRMERLVGDLTDLDTRTSEDFQVINYGIGGIFDSHVDFLQSDENRNFTSSERYATMLIFLGDVTQGGATLFTELNVTVFPEPGGALFFYNLDKNGEHDYRTMHTGCPVIVGSKWIMTKWIHYNAQVFKRPCTSRFSTARKELINDRI